MSRYRFTLLSIVITSLMTIGCTLTSGGSSIGSTATDTELALAYAPIHYQDTDSTNSQADYITAIDYDGDWDAANNWENFDSGSFDAVAYYSITETCTHWMITYSFFHPHDWVDGVGQEHENDIEGMLVIVRKDAGVGTLEGIVTVFHSDFYTYTTEDSPLTSSIENIDGTLTLGSAEGSDQHPLTAQEAKGHGMKAYPFIEDFTGESSQDGIIYTPSLTTAETPSDSNDRSVSYQLIDTAELWNRQLDEDQGTIPAITFAEWGTLIGDEGGTCGDGPGRECNPNSANTAWGWDDHNDGPVYRGEMALDPAHLVNSYFSGLGEFSLDYLRNPFIEGLIGAGYSNSNLPKGWPDEINLDALSDKMTDTCS